MNINLDKIFPIPVWYADLDIDNKELYHWCKKFQEIDRDGASKSNMNGWHSKDIVLEEFFHVNPVRDLFFAIMEMANQAATDYNYVNTNKTIKIANAWINVNDTKESYNETHVHPNTTFSGAYYVKCNDYSGSINFHRNFYERFLFHCYGTIDEASELSAEGKIYKPLEGRLLLFPSYLPHSVSNNLDDSERVSMSFNVDYSGWNTYNVHGKQNII